MSDFESLVKDTVLIFSVAGKKESHFGINAMILDSMFSNSDWLHSVNFRREQFETGNLKIVLIDVETENNMALK